MNQCLKEKRSMVFDTNVLINFWNKKLEPGLLDRIPRQQRFYTIISGAEFFRNCSADQIKRRQDWLTAKGMKRLHLSSNVEKTFWNLILHYPRVPGGIPDRLIAAITLVAPNSALATENINDFKFIAGLHWVDDFAPPT